MLAIAWSNYLAISSFEPAHLKASRISLNSDPVYNSLLTGLKKTRFGEAKTTSEEDIYLGAVIYHVLNALPPNSHEIDEMQVRH